MGGRPEQEFDRFVTLLARHQRRLYQHIRALVPGSADADDVLQETLLVLWRKFAEFEEGTSFQAWAARVAYLEVLKFRQRRSRDALVLDDDVLQQVSQQSLDRLDLLNDRRGALRTCVTKLRPVDRELLQKRYEQGVKCKDLATELGRTPNSISQSLARIRRWLWECVNRTVAASTARG